jgi:hypothetical protein
VRKDSRLEVAVLPLNDKPMFRQKRRKLVRMMEAQCTFTAQWKVWMVAREVVPEGHRAPVKR